MNASIPQPQRSLSAWLSAVAWLSAFLSPTAYFLLLLLANKFRMNVPETVAWSLFFLIPLVALLICESVGRVVLQQDSWSQDWLDAFHTVGDRAPVRNNTCDF